MPFATIKAYPLANLREGKPYVRVEGHYLHPHSVCHHAGIDGSWRALDNSGRGGVGGRLCLTSTLDFVEPSSKAMMTRSGVYPG